MDHTTQLVYLLRKHLNGTLTPDEEHQLRSWADSDPAYQQLLDEIHDEESFRTKLLAFNEASSNEAIWENPQIWGRIRPDSTQRKAVVLGSWIRWVYRVAAMLLVFFAVYLVVVVRKQDAIKSESKVADIAPGGNKAVLTLADGRVVVLDSEQTGIVVKANKLIYSDGSDIPFVNTESQAGPQMLQIVTPRGGQYQVMLSDGTKVWLNAATTLRYPSHFSGTDRAVEIEGEGFFSVDSRQASAAAKKPFIVKSRGQIVRVLGTEFNITSYNDEPTVKTTVSSGAVQLIREGGTSGLSDIKLVKSGQQGIVSNGEIQVKTVDISSELAWTKGKFSFSNKSFAQVMAELARWYNLELVYEGDVPDQRFFGEAYRDNNLAIVLKLLESANIAYRIKDRKLIINNKK